VAALAATAPRSVHGDGRGGSQGYAHRRPEESVLYGVVRSELETFLARAQARERPEPRFVERELRGFLRCGILAYRAIPTAGPREPFPASDATGVRPRRLAWAGLLQRVFAVDVLECPRCGGPMRLLATIHPPDVTQAILGCLELPSRAPPTAAAAPDLEEWDGDLEASL
jgi:hypothetical protein